LSSGPTNVQGSLGVGVALFRTGSTGTQTITPGNASIITVDDNDARGQQGEHVSKWAMATQSVDQVNFPEQAEAGAHYGTTARFAKGERPFLAGDMFNTQTFYQKDAGSLSTFLMHSSQITVTVIFDRSGSYGNFYGGSFNPVLQS
jgi:hypothetical protein